MDEPLLPRAVVREIDQRLMAAGVPGVLLMENAGRGAADEIASRMRAQGLRRVRVLVGPATTAATRWWSRGTCGCARPTRRSRCGASKTPQR